MNRGEHPSLACSWTTSGRSSNASKYRPSFTPPALHHLLSDIGFTTENTPSLHSLHLQNEGLIHPPTDRSLYHNLRILKLRSCGWVVPFDQLLDVLESMVNVENLHLHKSLLHMAGVSVISPTRHAQIVTLPQLRTLTLTSNPFLPTTRIISSLNLPAVTSVSLTVGITGDDPEGIVAALPQDRSLAFPMWDAITSVEVYAQNLYDQYGFHATNATKSHEVDIRLDTMFSTYVDNAPEVLDGWPFSLSRVLADFADVFSQSPITELTIAAIVREYSRESVSDWINVFDRSSHLETIDMMSPEDPEDFEQDSAHTFWMALSQTPSSPDRGAVYCPRLRVVMTCGLYCVRDSERSFWAMPRALRARKDRGYMLEKLDLHLMPDAPNGTLRKGDNKAYLAQVEECVGMLYLDTCSDSESDA
ncbi:hypothetical protein L226DRAFT_535316 [Lentinus tigrinus ALCF2SS1-7]|uniref:uncharacterized protein n=1 Tax=Lentinus tigrinus ALCF2SS1-7 TaxID=1328758 RepID=UPI001165DAD8|nr:hypothetical protein L226DRAFT_535316 [Lentinus tigrinus ALCF2SS1-7]